MSRLAGRPFTDAQLRGTCAQCGKTQTLAEARVMRSPAATEYRCHNGCALLARVVPGPGGQALLEARVEIRQDVPSLNTDPNVS
jgi:hypothetical protein